MNVVNLLVEIFLQERNEEGFRALVDLLRRGTGTVMTVYADGKEAMLKGEEAVRRIGEKPFNIIEASLEVDYRPGLHARLQLRYRPPVSSKTWAHLEAPDPTQQLKLRSEREYEALKISLSLLSLDHSSAPSASRTRGAFQFLCHSVPLSGTIEATIFEVITGICPELMQCEFWGIADPVPFRGISPEDEWGIARTMTMWREFSDLQHVHFNYLLTTANSDLEIPRPKGGVSQGGTTIYRIERKTAGRTE